MHAVAVGTTTTCPGCRVELPVTRSALEPLPAASAECREVYAEVQGFELSDLALVRDFHQLAVDAYAAQHPVPDTGPLQHISIPYSLVGLHLALDRGVPGVQVRAAHQRMGRPDRTWPRFPPPEDRGTVTAFDVAAAGVMVGSVDGHAAAMHRWAAAVWQAWAPHHRPVAELADRLLG